MYVATKGGEEAIKNAHRLLDERRSPRSGSCALTIEQIIDQMWLAVSRVMTEGSVYDAELAAMAIKQSQGDLVEATFLLRAYRTTLPRFAVTEPINTRSMRVSRRVSATFKDVPGGQLLGPTFDYSHRLLQFDEATSAEPAERLNADTTKKSAAEAAAADASAATTWPPSADETAPLDLPHVLDVLDREALLEPVRGTENTNLSADLTREPLSFPADRPLRLQALARGDEGFLLGLAYSTQRGYGSTHPFVGEIRIGTVEVELVPDELDFPIVIGEIEVTECEMINQFRGTELSPPQFTRGYGLTFGQAERKAMAMSLVDRSMRAEELGESSFGHAPAQDIEFVLSHMDNLEASGFVQHLKLPHYVDFQSELVMVRDLRDDWEKVNSSKLLSKHTVCGDGGDADFEHTTLPFDEPLVDAARETNKVMR
jgi:alpha-D-ribose 1-methylphosphonate 5-triphosphate synthase subunit PhnI